jgi:hypothetical protein
MSRHLSEETLMDLVDGTAPSAARDHVAACEGCRARVAEAAEAWNIAQASAVPEPPDLYWEAFRRQVGRRIEGGGGGRAPWRPLWLLPLAAAAGLTALAVVRSPQAVPSPAPSVLEVLPAWSALPAPEDDEGLAALQAVAATGSDLAAGLERPGVHGILASLSDEESRALAERLRSDLQEGAS